MKRFLLWLSVCVASAALGGASAFVLVSPRFPEGARIAEVPVGGLTREEAVERLQERWTERLSRSVVFRVPGNPSLEVAGSLWDAGLRLDAEATLEAALRRVPMYRLPEGRSGSSASAAECARWALDEAAFERFRKAMRAFERPRGKARLRYEKGAVSVVVAAPGRIFDADAAVRALKLAAGDASRTVTIPFAAPPPDERERALTQIRFELGAKTTSFKAYQTSRSHNIKLAARALDGVVLLPGEVFSYNEVVGRRTASRGYRVAPMFVNGRHVPGVGGGVCQASSTVYNAALLSGLKIRERHNHQLVVGYVPVGLDATVDFGSKDLKFENDTGGPVAIVAEYKPGRLTVRILGSKHPSGRRYELVVADRRASGYTTKEIPDPSLPPGERRVVEKGGRGFRCASWRYVYDGDVLIRKEFLGRSRYMPSTRIVRVGTAKPLAPGPEAPAQPPPADTASDTAEPSGLRSD